MSRFDIPLPDRQPLDCRFSFLVLSRERTEWREEKALRIQAYPKGFEKLRAVEMRSGENSTVCSVLDA